MSDNEDFFTRNQQFRRDFARSFRATSMAFWSGPLYVLAGFYCFQRLGRVQVYDVLAPFGMAALVMAFMTTRIHLIESTATSGPIMYNLPRDRTVWWRAQAAYLVAVMVWLEGWAFVGTYLKLGGAEITPHYRLYPEAMVLPLFVVATLVCWDNAIRAVRRVMILLIIMLAATRAIIYIDKFSDYRGDNPPRDLSLGWCILAAIIMLAWSVILFWRARRSWECNQRGERG